ncbi:hypothetical protein N7444_009090 [Penicillium canescens]|nr:hypothetical protein N7444_009090 [Penicillium canescens]
MAGFVTAFMNPLNYVGGVSFSPETDIPDLSGKVILVTGGNAGLGKETILQLIKHNPKKIFLGARSESKAQNAIKYLKSSVTNDVELSWLPLDLMSGRSIKNAAAKFNAESSRLDILVLNAGVMALPPGRQKWAMKFNLERTIPGISILRTEEADSDVRVVSLSSIGHNLAPSFETILDQEKLKKVNTNARYGASKAANILFAAELGRRYPSITSVSVHPGIIVTDLYNSINESSPYAAIGTKTLGFFGSSVPQGACNQLWAAAGAKKADLSNGGYYVPVGNLKCHNKYVANEDMGKRLWEWTEAELVKAGL